MATSYILYVDNDNLFKVSNLTNVLTGQLIVGAGVEVTIKDLLGNNVTGESWPKALSDEGAGNYQVTLEAVLAIEHGKQYIAIIDAIDGSGLEGHWEAAITGIKRQ